MRYHRMKNGSLADGPGGPRSVLWLMGCTIRCPGCQNPELWSPTAGHYASPYMLARQFYAFSIGEPLTITGGEPFNRVRDLSEFVSELRKIDNVRDIIVYTGYTVEQLIARFRAAYDGTGPEEDKLINDVFLQIDTLVDGPYVQALDDDHIQWRGSRNQRAIDTRHSFHAGLILPNPDGPDRIVTRDWDVPTVDIVDGRIVTTGGLADDLNLNGLGPVEPMALCGQAGEVYGEEDRDYNAEVMTEQHWQNRIAWRML